jgi:hypothetical protein
VAIQQREALIDKLKQNNLKDCIKYLILSLLTVFLDCFVASLLAMTEENSGLLCFARNDGGGYFAKKVVYHAHNDGRLMTLHAKQSIFIPLRVFSFVT